MLLVCIYWVSSWGEGLSAPTPRFNIIDQSQADLKAFEKMGKPVDVFAFSRVKSYRRARTAMPDKLGATDVANFTGDENIAAEGKKIDSKIEDDMKEFDDWGEVSVS